MIATAVGFGGEHVHYDNTWHSAAELAFAKVAALKADQHRDHHDHQVDHTDHADSSNHDQDSDAGAPIKHSHADQVHAAAFVIVHAPQLIQPDTNLVTATAPAAIPLQRHPYPPFRPPQAA
ncbi:MAG: hypothetical protein K2P94_12720 [Rhodospirillaceae bacterium]|nr:hypothetical protein [Rhodospirillaceae bacterium]